MSRRASRPCNSGILGCSGFRVSHRRRAGRRSGSPCRAGPPGRAILAFWGVQGLGFRVSHRRRRAGRRSGSPCRAGPPGRAILAFGNSRVSSRVPHRRRAGRRPGSPCRAGPPGRAILAFWGVQGLGYLTDGAQDDDLGLHVAQGLQVGAAALVLGQVLPHVQRDVRVQVRAQLARVCEARAARVSVLGWIS